MVLFSEPQKAVSQYPLVSILFRELISLIHYRTIKSIDDFSYFHDCCFPGFHRLFCDIDGNYYPCERTERSYSLQIGNITNGINIEKIFMLYNKFRTFMPCDSCSVRSMCSFCFSNIHELENSQWDKENFKKGCARIKNIFQRGLIDYVSIMEISPDTINEFCKRTDSQEENIYFINE
ncbi:MAG: hypothetical protein LBC68_13530 [Prevotellaceae bacterium]|jgi:radical SAM protein with 4Fe4S-binding SPASM domain|nr:hypothetical protein [Prevotellaceae bacterium]